MNIFEPSPEQVAGREQWIASLPDHVQRVAERFHPWKLYRLKSTDQRVITHSFDEQDDGSVTLKVIVSAKFNMLVFERLVFGIDPDELEECDLPGEGEITGAVLRSEEDVGAFIEAMRDESEVIIGPDIEI